MKRRTPGTNLTQGIVHDLGVAIVTGVYDVPGSFPVEAELCRRYGASRTVLREAVKMLTAKGMLRARARHGTWVQPEESWSLLDPDVLSWLLERPGTPELLLEFAIARLAIEPAAAALAARVATPRARAAVQAAVDRMAAAERTADDALEPDIAFHMEVLRASGNRFFFQLRELIATTLRFSIRETNRSKGVPGANVADHRAIADAISAGRPQAAERATRRLVQETVELIRARLPASASRPPARPRAPARPRPRPKPLSSPRRQSSSRRRPRTAR